MSNDIRAHIHNASLSDNVYEVGGKHGQKGVDFQRYWALSRIIELASSGTTDFLILFESFQDVAEFDHPTNPKHARIYQLKMKASGEWKWKALTALPKTSRKKKKS
jgi:hypothetical protein